MTCERCKTLEAALRVIYAAVRGDEKAQHHDARAWLDERGIYNGDLDGSFASGDAVVAEVCRAALALPVEPVASAAPCRHANVTKDPRKGRRVCRDCGAIAPDVRPEGDPEWSAAPASGGCAICADTGLVHSYSPGGATIGMAPCWKCGTGKASGGGK